MSDHVVTSDPASCIEGIPGLSPAVTAAVRTPTAILWTGGPTVTYRFLPDLTAPQITAFNNAVSSMQTTIASTYMTAVPWQTQKALSGAMPIGVIVQWAGSIAAIPTNWHLCDGLSGTPDLRSKFVKGSAAGLEPGVTGGAATHTHALHSAHVVTQPAAHAVTQPSAHNVTQAGAHSAHVVTQPSAHSAHVVTQPAAHVTTQPTAASEATHTHAYSTVIAHVHGLNVQGGTTAATTGTHAMTSTAVGGSARAVTAGDAVITTGSASGTSASGATHTHTITGAAVDAHSGSAVDAHSAHTGTTVDAHSAHAGTAVDAHAGTAVSAHSGAAVDAHSAHDTVSNEPAYYSLAYIQKVA